jgi:hypothetical protein
MCKNLLSEVQCEVTVGIPNGRFPPPLLGISTRRTGGGMVIWDRYLHTDPEGPTLISNTALRFGSVSSRIRDTLAA